jgi:predicted nucleic acid-binding protein
MTVFPDTSFLCALYRRQINSSQAIAFMSTATQPLPVSSFLLLEFRQSVRLQVKLHSSDKTKGYGKREADAMLQQLQADLAAGVLQVAAVDWSDVHRLAERLSASYTEARGHRLADILHVATALHLGVPEFLTFDANQRKLAEAEGMSVPV